MSYSVRTKGRLGRPGRSKPLLIRVRVGGITRLRERLKELDMNLSEYVRNLIYRDCGAEL